MILSVGLLEVKLHQLFDLKNLTERDEQIVLSQLTVMQNNFTGAAQRIRVGCFSIRFETSFEPPLKDTGRTASFGNQLMGLNIAEFHRTITRRSGRLWLNRELARNIAAADVRRNLSEVKAIIIVSDRRLQLLKKKPIAKRNLLYPRIPM